ncbi:MAG: hypothetical protein JO057_08475, partial [Chloroflexi bacterium]|nr:hypothetical protein [Chloroflexota bacterium]
MGFDLDQPDANTTISRRPLQPVGFNLDRADASTDDQSGLLRSIGFNLHDGARRRQGLLAGQCSAAAGGDQPQTLVEASRDVLRAGMAFSPVAALANGNAWTCVRIARVKASLHRVPVDVPLLPTRRVGVVVVQVESDSGLIGYGVAGGGFQSALVELINREIAPAVVGRDPLLGEDLAHGLEQRFNARGMTGVVSCALSGVDIALWDLRGKALGQPTWKLLGGYSAQVPAYITFGLPEYDVDQLVEAARLAVSRGYDRL